MPEAVIVAAARSPIGRAFKGSLVGLRPDDMAAQMVRAVLAKHSPDVDSRRHALLDGYEAAGPDLPAPDRLRTLAGALVRPAAAICCSIW